MLHFQQRKDLLLGSYTVYLGRNYSLNPHISASGKYVNRRPIDVATALHSSQCLRNISGVDTASQLTVGYIK